jgi:hypothetical protein
MALYQTCSTAFLFCSILLFSCQIAYIVHELSLLSLRKVDFTVHVSRPRRGVRKDQNLSAKSDGAKTDCVGQVFVKNPRLIHGTYLSEVLFQHTIQSRIKPSTFTGCC